MSLSALLAGLGLGACLDMRESAPVTQPDDAPLIGRLQMQDRTVDLTVNAFAGTPSAVSPRSYARVMADCQVCDRPDAREEKNTDMTDRDARSARDLRDIQWNGQRNGGLRP